MHNPSADGPGRLDDARRVVDHVPGGHGVGQCGDRGAVTDDAALELHGEDRGVRGGEELSEVDGHETET
jgi:hypothetical protein